MPQSLQKLVHGLVPSWLFKLQSRKTASSRKKLLPWLITSNSCSGRPPVTPTPSPSRNVQTLSERSTKVMPADPCPSCSRAPDSTSENAYGRRRREELQHFSDDVKPHSQRHNLQDLLLQDGMPLQWQDYELRPSFEAEPGIGGSSAGNVHEQAKLMQKQACCRRSEGQEIPNSSRYSEASHQGVGVGMKRKPQFLHSDDNDEDEEGASPGGSIGLRVEKRRQGERTLTSYDLPESISNIVGNGKAVVKQILDPQLALWESMVEMIVGNGLWQLAHLEYLLFCYLSLNEPHLYPIIESTFLQVLKDLQRIP